MRAQQEQINQQYRNELEFPVEKETGFSQPATMGDSAVFLAAQDSAVARP